MTMPRRLSQLDLMTARLFQGLLFSSGSTSDPGPVHQTLPCRELSRQLVLTPGGLQAESQTRLCTKSGLCQCPELTSPTASCSQIRNTSSQPIPTQDLCFPLGRDRHGFFPPEDVRCVSSLDILRIAGYRGLWNQRERWT